MTIALSPSLAASDRVGQPPGPSEGAVLTLDYWISGLQVFLSADGRTVTHINAGQAIQADLWANAGATVTQDVEVAAGWNFVPIINQRVNTNEFAFSTPTLVKDSRKIIDINISYLRDHPWPLTFTVEASAGVYTPPPALVVFNRPSVEESSGLRMQHQRSSSFFTRTKGRVLTLLKPTRL